MFVGIICIICASVAFGFAPVFAKEITGTGMDTISMLVSTNAVALIVSGAVLLVRKSELKVTKKQLWQLLVFGGGGYGLTILLLNSAYRFLPIGLGVMLHFIYPTVVTVGMVVFFKERISVMKAAAVIVSIAGLFLILDTSGETSFLGAALALGSGLAYAVYVAANRKCNYSGLPPYVIVFSTVAVPFLGFITFQLITGNLMLPPTARAWILVAGAGVVDHLFAVFMLTCAIRRLGATNAAIGNMLEPVTSVLAGAALYSDRIPLISLGGCALVLLAVLFIVLDERRTARRAG